MLHHYQSLWYILSQVHIHPTQGASVALFLLWSYQMWGSFGQYILLYGVRKEYYGTIFRFLLYYQFSFCSPKIYLCKGDFALVKVDGFPIFTNYSPKLYFVSFGVYYKSFTKIRWESRTSRPTFFVAIKALFSMSVHLNLTFVEHGFVRGSSVCVRLRHVSL